MILSLLSITQGEEDDTNSIIGGGGPRPCTVDSECSLTLACISNFCSDPCQATAATPCPMKGGVCKVLGHRPVCSCPAGTENINSTCTSDTSCNWSGRRYEPGEHYYDENCEQRCQCQDGEFICGATSCSPGLRRRGLLTDPECVERPHPGGDECCVLWLCADQDRAAPSVCEDIICGDNALCQEQSGLCQCREGFSGDPNDLTGGCSEQETGNNIKLLQITSTTIQVQFPDITGGNLMYIQSRLLGRKDPPWENAILVEGNKIFTLTGLHPDTEYTLRWKAPDRQYPDVLVSTLQFDQDQKPKVILTGRSHDSVTLSFDQFRPPGYSHGYVASWRERESNNAWVAEEREPSGVTPSIVISSLKPDTEYAAKISIYKDYNNRVLGKSTEEIKFRTLPGCQYNSSYYAVGEFYLGCQSRCRCELGGAVDCSARCSAPLHPRGAFKDDIFCVERPADPEGCCVVVHCADTADTDSPCQDTECGPNAECRHEVLRDTDTNTICVCREGYRGDPDSERGCELVSDSPQSQAVSAGCVDRNQTYQPGQTWYDGCEYKCWCSDSKEILCEPRCKIITENVDSSCELMLDPTDSCCQTMVCPEVWPGNNTNVLQPSLPIDGCVFKNKTYQREATFEDGCERQCQCMGSGDLVCVPLCPPTKPELGEDCYTLPDVTNPCCNVTVCGKHKLSLPDVVKIPTLDTEETTTVTVSSSKLNEKRPRLDDSMSEGEGSGVYIGKFAQIHHGVQGELYAFNESILVVKDFSYNGEGVDVFFWASTSDKPDGEGVILPYPFTGIFYDFEDSAAPVLGKVEKENILLHLHPDISLRDIKWLSVFSRLFGTVFGTVEWPADIELDFSSERPPLQEETERGGGRMGEVEELEEVGGGEGCKEGNQTYSAGQEFYRGCSQYCICEENGQAYCSDIQCPSGFGKDVINPNCILWDDHEEFQATPPLCCPPVPTCLSDGSCEYKGETFPNYEEIPANLTGCEQRCHCDNGEVNCRDACYPLPASPPRWLACQPETAIKKPNPDRTCCTIWACPPVKQRPCGGNIPAKLLGTEASPYNDSCVTVEFEQPECVAGLEGWYRVNLSPLVGAHHNPDGWPARRLNTSTGHLPTEQVLFGESQLSSVQLCSLEPGSHYLLRPSIVLEDHQDLPIVGDIVSVKTPITVSTTPQPLVVYVDMELEAVMVGTDSAKITWRHFDVETEKPHIDGVQLRSIILKGDIPDSVVPVTSPFIHRDTNYYLLEALIPDTKYEIEVDLIPVPGSGKEIYSGKRLTFTTKKLVDLYNFSPELEVVNVSRDSVEVAWTGVPSPDQKYVNIYRVIYHSINSDREVRESSVFKISNIDSPKRITVTRLDSELDYQIWLEAYLTNGKIIKSNVQEFRTLPRDPSAQPAKTGQTENNYYQSMVAAAIVAAVALFALFIILYFYLKRHTTYTATITKERPVNNGNNSNSTSAYDNPAFKGYDTVGNLNHTAPGPSIELGPIGLENP